MIPWLLKTMGVSDEFAQHPGEATLACQYPDVLWVGLVLLVPISIFIFWRQQRNLASAPPALRVALSLTRIAVLALLIGVLSGPVLKLHHESEKKPIVALLFDHSQSMQLPAGPFDSETDTVRMAQAAGYRLTDGKLDTEARKALSRITRAKLAQSVVQANSQPMLERLAKDFELQYYSFAKEAKLLGVDPAHPVLPEPPNPAGTETHIGDAIAHVFAEASGRQVAGILLFSDGQNTGGRSPSEAAQAAAAGGTPIFTVPTGASTRLRDIAIVDVFTSGLVAIGDTVRIAVTIESQGFDKRKVPVQLKEGDKLLDSKELELRGTEQQQVELTVQADKPGARYFTVHIPPQPEEPEYLRSNNTDIAFVRVTEEKLRVLYVEGKPRWDFRFLKNAMRRDHGLGGKDPKEPDIILEAEWNRWPLARQAAALPRTIKDLAEYHTIVLGDVSPHLLDSQWLDLLAEAVRERGVGLVVAAGPQHMPRDYDKRLRELLPVRLSADPEKAGMEPLPARPFRLELTPEGSIHEAMRFFDDPGRNQNAWSHMPAYYWCLAALRPSPAASVLIWNPSVENNYGKLPLVASHYAGKGRVMVVGTDSTFLWRQNVGDRFFYKFWGQSLRHVARRDEVGSKKSWMEVRPVRAQPGEQAQVELMAFAADGAPRTESKLRIRVQGDEKPESVELTADPTVKGRYTGKVTPKSMGDYRLTFEPGGAAEPVEARLRVMDASEELRHPNVNRPALESLAGTSKGFMVELPDLANVADQLKGEAKLTKLDREASLWDNWLTLALLMFIYSLDVGLRRLVGLS